MTVSGPFPKLIHNRGKVGLRSEIQVMGMNIKSEVPK